MKKKRDTSDGVGFPVTARYVARHARRSFAGTLLALLLAAFLVGTVGQMAQLRDRYGDLVANMVVDVRFYNDFDYEKAKLLEESGYVRDPVYLKTFDDVRAEVYTQINAVFTNRIDEVYMEPITWLEGWDEESFLASAGKYCLMPAPMMDEMGFQVGDKVLVCESQWLQHLRELGYPIPKTEEEAYALVESVRPKITIVGRIETANHQYSILLTTESYRYCGFMGGALRLDSATYKLCSYYDADEFRDYVKELLTKRRVYVVPGEIVLDPVFRMDTTDADRLYRSHQLLNTMFPVSIAAALVLGTLLPILMVLQSQQEAAVFRALGWPKRAVTLRYVLEQGLLCLVGILIAFLILPVINGGDLTVFRPVLLIYALAHLLACMAGIAFASRLALAKSPMALLQAKE